MKKLFFIPMLALCVTGYAQIYKGKESSIRFFSAAPLENIEAINSSAQPMLNAKSGAIQVAIAIKGFKFEKPLMEEHFNENYMESDKFPSAVFKGTIKETIDYTKDGETKVTVNGKLDMHGVIKDVVLTGSVTIKGGVISLSSKFKIKVADYNIKVPSLYVKNIAEEVEITVNSTLEPFKK